MSNTFIEGGDGSLEAIIADTERGLLLKGGYWGYVFTARGQFTCNVENAWEIENGRSPALPQRLFAGLTMEMLSRGTRWAPRSASTRGTRQRWAVHARMPAALSAHPRCSGGRSADVRRAVMMSLTRHRRRSRRRRRRGRTATPTVPTNRDSWTWRRTVSTTARPSATRASPCAPSSAAARLRERAAALAASARVRRARGGHGPGRASRPDAVVCLSLRPSRRSRSCSMTPAGRRRSCGGARG